VVEYTLPIRFQPTPSCRGRQPARAANSHRLLFQPTPSCRGRHFAAGISQLNDTISTHALVQRAAKTALEMAKNSHNFNPRPRAEGGSCPWRRWMRWMYFNPRPRAEGGGRGRAGVWRVRRFQPTPSCRGRRWMGFGFTGGADFNPRPRAEGGRAVITDCPPSENFNPRPRAEGGITPYGLRKARTISTHALVQRAALQLNRELIFSHYFNPRPRAEGGRMDGR